MSGLDVNPAEKASGGAFPHTRWSLVIAAGVSGEIGPKALSSLCEIYWYPIYSFLRRDHNKSDAEDLTQGFFEILIRRDDFAKLTTKRGKFRTFLLSALQNFQTSKIRWHKAEKRGGQVQIIPIDFSEAEQIYRNEETASLPPDRLFEVRFAYALFGRAMERLKTFYRGRRKDDVLDELIPFLSPHEGSGSYQVAAANLGCSEGAARKGAHDLRQKFKECFRAEVFETVGDFNEVDDEILHLISLLGERWPIPS